MGSQVSVVVANLVMEDEETRAIEPLLTPPRLWLRYVDDTFVIIEKKFLNIFFDHRRSQDFRLGGPKPQITCNDVIRIF